VTDDVAAFYDDFAHDYADAILADFDQVSRRQGQQLQALLHPRGVRRVLDVACGNGLQSIALAELGYQVTGLDISPGMIAQAKRNAERHRVAIEWIVGDWHDLARTFASPFDAVVCWGNSLSHVADADDLTAVLGEMASVTAPSGVCLVDLRDWDRVSEERPKGQIRQAKETPEGRLVSFDLWHYPSPEAMIMEVFVLRERGGQWEVRRREVVHRMISRAEFEAAATKAGFARIERTNLGAFDVWALEKQNRGE
jgi:ubiquinone/menaquinone biosynthesis C-methylase UbiE